VIPHASLTSGLVEVTLHRLHSVASIIEQVDFHPGLIIILSGEPCPPRELLPLDNRDRLRHPHAPGRDTSTDARDFRVSDLLRRVPVNVIERVNAAECALRGCDPSCGAVLETAVRDDVTAE